MIGDSYPGDPWTPCGDGDGDCDPKHCQCADACDEAAEPVCDDDCKECPEAGPVPACMWPEKWDAAKIAKMRRDPVEFARQFIQEPFDPLVMQLNAGRSYGRTQAFVDLLVGMVEAGVDIGRITVVCPSERHAERMTRDLVERLGPIDGLPKVQT